MYKQGYLEKFSSNIQHNRRLPHFLPYIAFREYKVYQSFYIENSPRACRAESHHRGLLAPCQDL